MPKKSSNKAKSQRSRERALLQKVHLNAAGIDIGADVHWVAVPEDRDASPVRSFGVFTRDLILLCEWLKRCQVETIVMAQMCVVRSYLRLRDTLSRIATVWSNACRRL